MRTRRPSTRWKEAALCPVCGSMRVVPGLYGLPGPDVVRDQRRGLVVLELIGVNQ
jgi:hypothetical protein